MEQEILAEKQALEEEKKAMQEQSELLGALLVKTEEMLNNMLETNKLLQKNAENCIFLVKHETEKNKQSLTKLLRHFDKLLI